MIPQDIHDFWKDHPGGSIQLHKPIMPTLLILAGLIIIGLLIALLFNCGARCI